MTTPILNIQGLVAGVGETPQDNLILQGLDLQVNPGEVHAIMGPNGAGKSTLSNVLSGKDGYTVTSGSVSFDGKDLLEMEAHIRAREGIFQAFQYPVEIPGVSNRYFLRAALDAVRKHRELPQLDAVGFLKLLRATMDLLGMDPKFAKREVNHGFSGGEKKKNEILQMALLDPRLCILDETDSGLDIDALKAVADGVNALRTPQRAMVIITHYQRLLDYIVPDVVHVLMDGRIVKSGGADLALTLEERGYDWIRDEQAA